MNRFLPKTTFNSSHVQLQQISWQEFKEALALAISTQSSTLKHLQCLHAQVISSGLGNNLHLCSLLIRTYFSFRCSDTALFVFRSQNPRPQKALLWNTLIRGFLMNGQEKLAFDIYHEMIGCSLGCVVPDKQTFNLVISACTNMSAFELGCQIAGHAQRRGLESDLLVGTALVNMHCQARNLQAAEYVFDSMTCRDSVTWNTMISGYSQGGCLSNAINLFKRMRLQDEIASTEATLVSLVSACGDFGFLKVGESIHGHAIKSGFPSNIFICNSLIKLYIKCHLLDFASKVFHGMMAKDVVSWSTLIGGYVEYGNSDIAIKLFHKMVLSTELLPTRPILLNVLLACADLGNWCMGKIIEKVYVTCGENRYELDASLSTALIYMHAKCGRLDISLKLLDENLLVRGDIIAWNIAIKACAELGQAHKASEVTLQMQRRGIGPDPTTFLVLLSIFSLVPLLKKGMKLHAHVIRRGFELERPISNALIDMYARSGDIRDARQIFNEIRDKDVVSWSSIIKGYAWNGDGDEPFTLFEQMMKTAIKPNKITFLAVLTACSHAGYVEKGKELFKCMQEKHGLQPALEHYACIVDLLCRAGLLSEARDLLENELLVAFDSAALWGTLLSACRVHGNWVVGEVAASHLFYLEPGNAGNYKVLADIYSLAGRRGDAVDVSQLLKTKVLERRSGYSWFDGGSFKYNNLDMR